jgi:hypothetical protein
LGGGVYYSKELEKITTLLVSSYVALGPPTPPFILEEIMLCICHDDGMIASFQDTFL